MRNKPRTPIHEKAKTEKTSAQRVHARGRRLLTDVNKPVRVELENGANGKADAHAGRGHGAASVLEPLILA